VAIVVVIELVGLEVVVDVVVVVVRARSLL
jgi:hypothetical protein